MSVFPYVYEHNKGTASESVIVVKHVCYCIPSA